jgi:RES domain-containing protein
MLERLVQRRNLGRTLMVEAEVPSHLVIEDLTDRPPPNWRALGSPEAMAAGGEWVRSGRTALLCVPSAVVPREANYLVNPAHPDAQRIAVSVPEPLEWDARFFGIPSPNRRDKVDYPVRAR